MNRRRLLASSALGGISLSGCLDGFTTPFGGRTPDPDLPVSVENRRSTAVTVTVTIERLATAAIVHEESHDLSAGESRSVFNTTAVDPDGIETFRVIGAIDGSSDAATVKTDSCYGEAIVTVQDDGVSVIYSIC